MNSFLELAKERYSVRKFKPDTVEEEKITKILEAGLAVPTARNNQPQRIYVLKSEESRKKLAELSPCTFDAPVIFMVGYDSSLAAVGRIADDYSFGDIDSAICTTHMMLEAWDLGLGSCWVGYFMADEVEKAFGLPENIRIRALLPVGYAADDTVPGPMHSASRSMADVVTEL